MILKEDILSKVTEKDIMQFYWGEYIEDNRAVYKNPMRTDSHGSCYFKWYKNKYVFTDRGGGIEANFDCFTYVRWLYNCGFYEALTRINDEMVLGARNKLLQSSTIKEVKKSVKVIQTNFKVETRDWNQADLDYWSQFGISIENLNKICKPVQNYKSNAGSFSFKLKYEYNPKDPCYVFIFGKRMKLYQPLSKVNKWKSNIKNTDIFGLKELPHFGDTLYITSGAKDMLCLWEMGLNSIAPQSECVDIPDEVMDDLKCRFNHIFYLFDNDNTGIKMSKQFSDKHQVNYIELPKINNCKDIAELCKQTNINKVKEIILNNAKAY